jgi:hypothetical protein
MSEVKDINNDILDYAKSINWEAPMTDKELIKVLQAKLSEAERRIKELEIFDTENTKQLERQSKLIEAYQKHVEIIRDDAEPKDNDLVRLNGKVGVAYINEKEQWVDIPREGCELWAFSNRGKILQLANGKYAVRESEFNNKEGE